MARTYKPGSVVFYHQSSAAVADGLYQPTLRQLYSGEPALKLPVYMVFQPMRLAITPVTRTRRGLLPRVFTLTFLV